MAHHKKEYNTSAGLRLWRPLRTRENEAPFPNFDIPKNRCSVVYPKIRLKVSPNKPTTSTHRERKQLFYASTVGPTTSMTSHEVRSQG